MNEVQSEDSEKHPCHVVGKELVVIQSYAIYTWSLLCGFIKNVVVASQGG